MKNNRIQQLFHIEYPIIQGGMVWVSGGKLAAAVSNAGGLGLIGAGSMNQETLIMQIKKAQSQTSNPIGVNIPLLYKHAPEQIKAALDLGIKIFFTSAGNPKLYTDMIHQSGGVVTHVTSSPLQALKAELAGVDAVVAEGFEAGGHNGKDEITSLVLIPLIKSKIKIPIIAAGGFANGQSILAAISLGADAVQMGTRFLMTQESRAHQNFKNIIIENQNDYTRLLMKNYIPVRLMQNKFSDEIYQIEQTSNGLEQQNLLKNHLGSGRAKKGMHEGDINEGELEAGQIASFIDDIPTCQELFKKLINEYNQALSQLQTL